MYDLIVVGAGIAGCTTAMKAAEKGVKVLLLDKRSVQEIGNDWTNGVEKEVFNETGIAEPANEELALPHNRYRLESPSGNYIEVNDLPMYEVNMRPFTKRLLTSAKNAGAEFRERTEVTEPVLENGKITGVVANGEEIRAKIVMDASGYDAVIRSKLPAGSPLPSKADDMIDLTAWRGQLHIEEDGKDVPGILGIPADTTVSRAGWLGGYSVFSVCWHSNEKVLDMLIGFNSAKSNQTAQQYAMKFLDEHNLKGKITYSGGGFIPVRRSLDILVDDNFLIAGDSACMLIPVHSSGVACSLIAGNIAARTIALCIKNNDTTKEALWNYTAGYQRGRGATMAFFDVVRLSFETLTPHDIDRLLGNLMLPGDMVAGLAAKPPSINIRETLARLKGLKHPLLVLRYGSYIVTGLKVRRHYMNYPLRYDRQNIEQWRTKLEEILAPVKM